MSIAFSFVDIQSDSHKHLFPAPLISSILLNGAGNFLCVSVGDPPFGALVLNKRYFHDNSINTLYYDIPFFSLLPQFFSIELVEQSLFYITPFLPNNELSVVFNLHLFSDLIDPNKVSNDLFIFDYITSSIETSLVFSQSLDRWQHLWKIFARNYNSLMSKYPLSIVKLADLSPPIFSDNVSGFPDWASPFNPGYYSPIDSPYNLVLLIENSPVAWLNSSLDNRNLLFENLWSYPGSNSALFSYVLLYAVFSSINDYQLNSPTINCIFSYKVDNIGMKALSHRLRHFISTSSFSNLYQVYMAKD